MGSKIFDEPDTVSTVSHTYTPIVAACPASYDVQEVSRIKRGMYAGAVTPGYHKLLKAGGILPLNGYQRFDSFESRPHGVYGGRYLRPLVGAPLQSYDYEVNSVRSVPGATHSVLAAVDKCTSLAKDIDVQALQQAAFASVLPDLDVLTTMVEAKKTAEMMVNARYRFHQLLRRAKRRGFQTAKAAASAWLEWRYGWSQLIRDIANVADLYNYPVRDLILDGRAGENRNRYTATNHPFSGYYVKHDYNCVIVEDLSVRVNAVVKFRGQSLNLIASPALTALETIPYSWVADWFVSAGDALKMWHVLLLAEETASSLGYHWTESGNAEVSNVQKGTGTYATNPRAGGGAVSHAEYRMRSPLGHPSLLPRIRVKLTSARIMDAAALLTQRIPT